MSGRSRDLCAPPRPAPLNLNLKPFFAHTPLQISPFYSSSICMCVGDNKVSMFDHCVDLRTTMRAPILHLALSQRYPHIADVKCSSALILQQFVPSSNINSILRPEPRRNAAISILNEGH